MILVVVPANKRLGVCGNRCVARTKLNVVINLFRRTAVERILQPARISSVDISCGHTQGQVLLKVVRHTRGHDEIYCNNSI